VRTQLLGELFNMTMQSNLADLNFHNTVNASQARS